jgi:hypothetical protein
MHNRPHSAAGMRLIRKGQRLTEAEVEAVRVTIYAAHAKRARRNAKRAAAAAKVGG